MFKQESLSYPFIAHVVKEGGLQHYYTVFGQIKGKLVIGDPDPSKKVIKMPLEEFAKEWTGVALFFVPGETYTKYKEDVPGLLSFLPILFRRKGLIAVIVLLSFLVTLVNIIGSYYLQSIIDRLIPQEAYTLLTMISLGLCISYLAQQVFTFFKDYLLHRLGNYLSIAVILPYIKHYYRCSSFNDFIDFPRCDHCDDFSCGPYFTKSVTFCDDSHGSASLCVNHFGIL